MSTNRYLRETAMLDFSSPEIQSLADDRHWKELCEFERIKATGTIQMIRFSRHGF